MKSIILTFDDGPHPVWTERILDKLGKNNAKGIFFLTGENVKRYTSIVRRIIKEGHAIGNHTWNHINLSKFSQKLYTEEILKLHRYFIDKFQTRIRYFRPPYGILDDHYYELLEKLKYTTLFWDIDSRDHTYSFSNIKKEIILHRKKEVIVIFHDGIKGSIRKDRFFTLKCLDSLFSETSFEFSAPGNTCENKNVNSLLELNKECYETYWEKGWKNRLRYELISKKNGIAEALSTYYGPVINKDIMDFGFGSGMLLMSYKKSNRLTGIEISDVAIKKALKFSGKDKVNRFIKYNGTGKIGLRADSFDIIFCSHVLEHVPDAGLILAEFRRLLRKEGIIVLNLPVNSPRLEIKHNKKYRFDKILRLIKKQKLKIAYEDSGDKTWDVFEDLLVNHSKLSAKIISAIINIVLSFIPYRLLLLAEKHYPKRYRPRQSVLCLNK